MHFRIHRSSKEIDSSCVEIWMDEARIVIATGTAPINNDDSIVVKNGYVFNKEETESPSREELIQKGILPDIPSLYEEGGNTALFICHSHREHYGLIKHVHPSCPVWIGKTTYWLMRKTCEFLGKDWQLTNVHYFNFMDTIKIGDIEVHACLMDQSSFDDYSFFIQTSHYDNEHKNIGKKLLYMCNTRHRGKKVFNYFLKKYVHEIDYLLIEGNSTGSNDGKFQTEEDIFEEFVTTFRQTKGINLVFISEPDVARIETIYRACGTCRKTFLIDFYTASVLKTIHKKAKDTLPFPSRENFIDVLVCYPIELSMITEVREKENEFINHFLNKKYVRYNYYMGDLDKMADNLVMLVRPYFQYDLEHYFHKYTDGCFIYSMWEGHKQEDSNKKFLDFIASNGMRIKNIHTSGYMDLSTLKQAVETIKPKYLLPIQAFEGDRYAELFPEINVVRVNDRETIEM